MGDILEVVGKYNNSPLLKFVRRKNVLLSVDHDKTDEEELHDAVRKAALILEKELPGVRLFEYTSYTNYVEPGNYVIIWELCTTGSLPSPSELPPSLLDRCCSALEASLNYIYREGRYEGIIGPLEIKVVLGGTFDLLFEYAISRGATINQYKVPRGLGPKQGALREIVMSRVTQSHSSSTIPPFAPATHKTKS
jgi:auxin responsive GH3 family protein